MFVRQCLLLSTCDKIIENCADACPEDSISLQQANNDIVNCFGFIFQGTAPFQTTVHYGIGALLSRGPVLAQPILLSYRITSRT